jgi:hypothetical protein
LKTAIITDGNLKKSAPNLLKKSNAEYLNFDNEKMTYNLFFILIIFYFLFILVFSL